MEGVSLLAPLPLDTDGLTGRTNNHSVNAASSSPLQQTGLGVGLSGGGSSTTMGMPGQQFLPPLQWDDKFFDNDNQTNNEVVGRREAGSAVIGVFDFDYDRIISYKTSVASVALASTSAAIIVACVITVMLALDPCHWKYYGYYDFFSDSCSWTQTVVLIAAFQIGAPILLFSVAFLLSCYPCFYRQQIRWQARSQHVAITQDGVLFVRDAHRTKCGLRCSDVGRVSTTVPFDKISSCDVKEPAGSWCWCIANVLSEVTICQIGGKLALDPLVGLKEPHKFQHVLMTMIKASRAGNLPHHGGQFAAADGRYNFALSQPAAGLPVAAAQKQKES